MWDSMNGGRACLKASGHRGGGVAEEVVRDPGAVGEERVLADGDRVDRGLGRGVGKRDRRREMKLEALEK